MVSCLMESKLCIFHRHRHRLRGTTDRARRYCKYCTHLNINVVEDEFHVVMICPLYAQLRGQSLTRYTVPPTPDIEVSY